MTGILNINKPAGWTSHDVVAKLRRALGERRIGHGGTLDPMATGVLPVFVGRATRAVEFMERADKAYLAGVRFGIVTDTQDTTGTVLESRGGRPEEAEVHRVLESFRGEMQQLPPLYSAIKVDGRKLYQYARAGKEVEREARSITLHEVEALGYEGEDYRFRVVCSKGTYIRTICHDLGQALGCGGAMSALTRLRAGAFRLEDAAELDAVVAAAGEGFLLPVDSLFAAHPALTVGEEQNRRVRCGNDFAYEGVPGTFRLYDEAGEFLALAESSEGRMKVIKSFFEV